MAHAAVKPILDEADEADDTATPFREKTWAIKNMPAAERRDALRAANRADMTIGEWLALAIRGKLNADAAPMPAVAAESPELTHKGGVSGTSLAELAAMVRVAADVASITGRKLPRFFVSAVHRELYDRLGVVPPPVKPRVKPPVKTVAVEPVARLTNAAE